MLGSQGPPPSLTSQHIHANVVILTAGNSHTVLLFLKEAAKKRDFLVRTRPHLLLHLAAWPTSH